VVAEWTRQINYPERGGLDKVSKAGTGPSGVNAVLLACCNKRVAEDRQIDRRAWRSEASCRMTPRSRNRENSVNSQKIKNISDLKFCVPKLPLP